MASAVIKLSAILMFVAVCAADVWQPNNPVTSTPPVTEICLQCICHATSGCKQGVTCAGEVCGLFGITRPYWIDAGRPTIHGGPVVGHYEYPDCASDPDCASCTTDPHCAARTVQAYMTRFPQDCNSDGEVNCYDYMAIHRKGGYRCQGELPVKYSNVFHQCIAAFAAQQLLRN